MINKNTVSKLFEKCIEYKMITYIWKTAVAIPRHQNVLYISKVITDQFL